MRGIIHRFVEFASIRTEANVNKSAHMRRPWRDTYLWRRGERDAGGPKCINPAGGAGNTNRHGLIGKQRLDISLRADRGGAGGNKMISGLRVASGAWPIARRSLDIGER